MNTKLKTTFGKLHRFSVIVAVIAFLIRAEGGNAQVPWATGQSEGRDLVIKLVTFGPGEDIPSYWGHTALVVEDTVRQASRIYNFGLFSFDRTMLMRFAAGRLIFSGGSSQVPGYLRSYRNMNREIRIATLNLDPQKKAELAARLAWYVLPQNRDYLYHHYYENCSTRLRDLIDEAVDGQFHEFTDTPARMSLRDHTRRYVGRNPVLEFILMYLMSGAIDQPITKWDEMFLPDELERYVMEFSRMDSSGRQIKLVSDYFVFFEANRERVPAGVPLHWPGVLISGIVLGIIPVLLLKNSDKYNPGWPKVFYGVYNFTMGLLIGIPGLVLTLFSFFTDHEVTFYNENLFLASALSFIFIPAGFAYALHKNWAKKWIRGSWYIHLTGLLILLIAKIFFPFDQDNYLILLFSVPVIIGNVAAVYFQNSREHSFHL